MALLSLEIRPFFEGFLSIVTPVIKILKRGQLRWIEEFNWMILVKAPLKSVNRVKFQLRITFFLNELAPTAPDTSIMAPAQRGHLFRKFQSISYNLCEFQLSS